MFYRPHKHYNSAILTVSDGHNIIKSLFSSVSGCECEFIIKVFVSAGVISKQRDEFILILQQMTLLSESKTYSMITLISFY